MLNSLGGWFGFGWYAMLLLVGGSMVLRSVWAPVHLRRGASCGACGYEISKADAPCPECGAKLLKAGLNTPAAALRARGSVYLLAVGWLLVVASLATPAYTIAQYLVNQRQQQTMGRGFANTQPVPTAFTLRTNPFGSPHSRWGGVRGPVRLLAVAEGATDEWGEVAMSATRLELAAAPGTDRGAELSRGPGQSAWTLIGEWGEAIAENQPLTDGLARSFFETAGFDAQDATFARAAGAVPTLVERLETSGGPPHARVSDLADDQGPIFQSFGSSASDNRWEFMLGLSGATESSGRPTNGILSVSSPPTDPEAQMWRVDVGLDLKTDEWGVVGSGTISMRLVTREAGRATLEYDVKSGELTVEDEQGEPVAERARGLDRSASLAFFEAAGLDRRDPVVRGSIKALPALVDAIEDAPTTAMNALWQLPGNPGQYLQVTDVAYGNTGIGWGMPGLGTGPGGGMTALEWAMWGTLAAAAAVYFCGLFALLLLRRRTLRPVRSPIADS